MARIGRFCPRRYYCRAAVGRIITFLLLLFAVSPICLAQAASGPDQPLAPDTGSAALKLELLRLRTTARMLHTTAHPDDEDGGMLVLESRGRGVTTELLTLTRGEGGQNRLGSNLFDELGALRTLELLASDRYYGVQQRFTRAVDFGFSKTADETFEKWGGQHGPVLADVVRVIRTFRPDVIASRFQGSARDGHGHHQATAIITREAFRAAADPTMFPEQIRAGLAPWQAKKLYVGNIDAKEGYTLALDTSAVDPALATPASQKPGLPGTPNGMSYQQFAMQGLRHQLSQGAADFTMRTGLHYYRLVDSAFSAQAPRRRSRAGFLRWDRYFSARPGGAAWQRAGEAAGVETAALQVAAFVDGGQQSGRARPCGGGCAAVQRLRVDSALDGAGRACRAHARGCARPCHEFGNQGRAVRARDQAGERGARSRLRSMRMRQTQIPRARLFPESRSTFSVRVELPPASSITVSRELGTYYPKVDCTAPMELPGWSYKRLQPAASDTAKFEVEVPRDAEYTQPYYHRDSSEQPLYTIDGRISRRCRSLLRLCIGAGRLPSFGD